MMFDFGIFASLCLMFDLNPGQRNKSRHVPSLSVLNQYPATIQRITVLYIVMYYMVWW